MSFKIRKTAYRAWPVSVTLQEGDAAGNVTNVTQTFVAHFKPFSERDFAEALTDVETFHPAPAVVPPASEPVLSFELILVRNADLFGRFVTGWGSEVTDESGNPIPYSTEALSDLVTGPDGLAVSAGFAAAFNELRFGRAAEKNSLTLAAPGDGSNAVKVGPANTSVATSPTI